MYISLDEEKLEIGKKTYFTELIESLIPLLNKERRIILVDEITFYDKWAIALKNLVDRSIITESTAFIVSGSYSAELVIGKRELIGRWGKLTEDIGGTYNVLPRKFSEYIQFFIEDRIIKLKLHDILHNEKAFDKIQEYYEQYKNTLHSTFLSYLVVGGYPRNIMEFYDNASEHISNSRYLEDIYKLIIEDFPRFRSGFNEDVKKLTDEELKLGLKLVIQLHNNPTGLIGKNTFRGVEEHIGLNNVLDFVNYLKASFSVGYIRNLKEIRNNTTIYKKSNKRYLHYRKYFYRDPFLYWAFLFGSQETIPKSIFKETKKLLKDKKLLGKIYESVVLSHLYTISERWHDIGEDRLYSYVISKKGQEIELCDVVYTYYHNGRRITLPFEISKKVKDSRDLHLKEIKDRLGSNKLIMVNGEKKLKRKDEIIYIPIELLLLLL